MRDGWKWNSKLIGLAAASLLVVPATVSAQMDGGPESGVEQAEPEVEEAADEAGDEDGEAGDGMDEGPGDDRPWSVGGGLMMMVGQGAFISPANDTPYADEVDDGSGAYSQVAMNVGINAGYNWEEYQFQGQFGFNQPLTAAASRTRPYQGRIQDINLSASRKAWEIADSGFEVSPSLSATLPTSTSSRTMTTLTSLSASASISKRFFGELGLSYSLGASRTFHRYTSPVMDQDEIQGDEELYSPLYRPDGTEDLGGGRFAIAGINSPWGMNHSLSANISFSRSFQLMADYSLNTSWSYPVVDEEDEFAHDRQCTGRCPRQMTSGGLMANYVVSKNLTITGGIRTTQTPKTVDNKTFAFPFWDFTRGPSNRSRMTIGINGTY